MNLERTVRELADRRAISESLYRYAECFDRNDPAGVAALFTADAVIDYNPDTPNIAGPDIAGTIAVGLRERFAATSHHISNILISFDGPDTASALCYVDAWHRYHDGSPDGFLWGRYRTRHSREADGWRISELRLQGAGTVDFHRDRMHPIGRNP